MMYFIFNDRRNKYIVSQDYFWDYDIDNYIFTKQENIISITDELKENCSIQFVTSSLEEGMQYYKEEPK